MMKRLLGVVKNEIDIEQQKRIQANIIGLTETVPVTSLPWAFPLDNQCIVPRKGDKVWIYVDQEQSSEDYDYNRLYYRKFTEETYKECYNYATSEVNILKNSKKLLQVENYVPHTIVYPKNRVYKISNITVEYDEQNKRYCVTDENGNYFQMRTNDIVVKSTKDLKILAKEKITIYSDGKEIKLHNKTTNQFSIKNSGKFKMTQAAGDLKDILKNIQELLVNILTVTNWLGNAQAPLVYNILTDLPKANALLTKINTLLE